MLNQKPYYTWQMVEKRRPIWSSLDVSFSSPTTVDKEPFLCTLKKLYNLYSGFTHYRNYRAGFLFLYVQSDEDTFPKVNKVSKTEALTFNIFD